MLIFWKPRLGDLREGRCSYGFFYNSNACCTGLDGIHHCVSKTSCILLIHLIAGEICQEWQSWGDHFNVQSILGHSLLQASIYVVLSVRNWATIIFANSNTFTFKLDHVCRRSCTIGCNIRASVRIVPSKVVNCD